MKTIKIPVVMDYRGSQIPVISCQLLPVSPLGQVSRGGELLAFDDTIGSKLMVLIAAANDSDCFPFKEAA